MRPYPKDEVLDDLCLNCRTGPGVFLETEYSHSILQRVCLVSGMLPAAARLGKCLELFFWWMEPKRVRPSTRKIESIFTSVCFRAAFLQGVGVRGNGTPVLWASVRNASLVRRCSTW